MYYVRRFVDRLKIYDNDYLHSKNICHRDLKLSNILMSSEGLLAKLKISDFGISKIWSSIIELRMNEGKFNHPDLVNLSNILCSSIL